MLFLALTISGEAFAAAGMADRFYDHQHWLFPAYAYCLGFGMMVLMIMALLAWVFKAKTRGIVSMASDYLKERSIWGIIVSGVIWGIIVGLIGGVLWEIIWFLALLPISVFICVFPFVLVIRPVRVKWLLSPMMLKWSGMVALSAVIASVLFIVLANFGVLPGTDLVNWSSYRRTTDGLHFYTHPYDSIMEIWTIPFIFMLETIVAIFIYYVGRAVVYWLEKIRPTKECLNEPGD